jgi:Na+/phosphate symporter
MEILISTSSDEHHKHPAEASAILFQVFMVFARAYVHPHDKENEEELAKLIPAFIDYANKMKAIRGPAETKTVLKKMYEEASRMLFNGIKSVHKHPKYAHLKKSVAIDASADHKKAAVRLVAYGDKFIDHIISGQDSNTKSAIADLLKLAA